MERDYRPEIDVRTRLNQLKIRLWRGRQDGSIEVLLSTDYIEANLQMRPADTIERGKSEVAYLQLCSRSIWHGSLTQGLALKV
jgi:hypothetical protein